MSLSFKKQKQRQIERSKRQRKRRRRGCQAISPQQHIQLTISVDSSATSANCKSKNDVDNNWKVKEEVQQCAISDYHIAIAITITTISATLMYYDTSGICHHTHTHTLLLQTDTV